MRMPHHPGQPMMVGIPSSFRCEDSSENKKGANIFGVSIEITDDCFFLLRILRTRRLRRRFG